MKMKLLNEVGVHKNSCLMFCLENSIAEKIIEYTLENISEETLTFEYGMELEPHITVFYGIHSDNYNDIKKYLNLLNKKIEVEFGLVTKFSTMEHDIIKIDVIDKDKNLENVWKLIKKNIPNSNKFDSYEPHITLSYVQKDTCNDLINDDYFKGMKIVLNLLKFSTPDENKNKFFRIKK